MDAMLSEVEGQCIKWWQRIMKFDFPEKDQIPEVGTVTYGDFGPARQEVQEAAGAGQNYNVEMSFMGGVFKVLGIVSEDGKTTYTWGMMNKVEVLKWLTDEELQKLNDDR